MSPGKVISSTDEAVADIPDGARIMVAGYAVPGTPQNLVKALLAKGVGGLTCISGPWYGREANLYDAARLIADGRVKRAVTSAPIHPDASSPAIRMWRGGQLEVETVPLGTLAERIRAGGAGLGGIYLATGVGTHFEAGKETKLIDGKEYIFEMPLRADYALLKAHKADTLGNLVYWGSQSNWNPIMAMAADVTIAEVDEIVQPGELDPELIVTPGIYVNKIVAIGDKPSEARN